MSCPDDNAILGFVEGTLPPDAREALALHIDTCADCRALLTGLSRAAVEDAGQGSNDAVGRYVLLAMLGAGGMGVVQSAFDRQLDRKVALKFLSTNPGEAPERARARLQREAQALAKLAHPNVITVHDVGVLDGEVFVAMELVDGTTLREWLARKPRSVREILSVMRQAGLGLAAAHAAGLVHRDFKPENVLVGDDARVRVTDFGLARSFAHVDDTDKPEESGGAVAPTLTRTGVRAGTPAYMAPEQQLGKAIDRRADIYSYCVTLHEALTGARPGAKASAGKARRGPAAWLERVIARGLRERPEERWPSMPALLDALARGPLVTPIRASVVLAVLALLALPAFAIARREKPASPCPADAAAFDGVWDDAHRESVRVAFLAAYPAQAELAFQSVDGALGRLRDKWLSMRTQSCVATRVRRDQSEMLLDLRTACLDAKRLAAGALVQVLVKADLAVVQNAPAAAADVSSLEECANVRALEASEPLPSDPARRVPLDEAGSKLASAWALFESGKDADSLALVEPALETARAAVYAPLEAKLLVLRAAILQDMGRPPTEIRDALHEAGRRSYEARVDSSAAQAWILLAFETRDHAGEGRVWAGYAESAIRRLGGDDYLEADRAETLAVIEMDDEKYDEARALLEHALPLFEKARGPEYYRIGAVYDALGTIALGEQRIDDAIRLHHQGRALRERALGPEHGATISSLFNEEGDLLTLGRFDEALAMLRDIEAGWVRRKEQRAPFLDQSFADVMRAMGKPAEALEYDRAALAGWAAELAAGDATVAQSLTGEGRDLLTLGRPAEAIAPLETVLRITPTSSSSQRSGALFLLARSLVAAGRDRTRAASLARQAEEILAPLAQRYAGQRARDLAEVQAWLRSR